MNLSLPLETMLFLLVFLPLFAAFITGIFSSIIPARLAQIITTSAVLLSAIFSVIIFKNIVLSEGIQNIHIKLFSWFDVGDFKASWALYVDVLTAVMFIVVTSISALVHIYSIGYMSDDPHKPRFMSYLSLFTFSMLMLVSADNFIQLFFGWEGVGLCSYLLIGFWYKKKSACRAAIKAFLVNRVGDFGFALGIFAIYLAFGSVEYSYIFANVETLKDAQIDLFATEINVITLICLLLLIGAMGKSAQIGLHTWLPDAMEGPTPVSALIHAATMVTAGVFMIAKCSPLFEHSPVALEVVTIVGAFTCFFAATVAVVQNDIKKIIAYSTCSQLGYMFFACGVSAYSAAIFHLATHAFFKALLFLGAGSVIHAMSNEQDITKMGGIWKKIPFTYVMMWIGSLALAGIYPFSGFYSKDTILEAAAASESAFGSYAYFIGLFSALLTAFYSWRLIILTFHGQPRFDEKMSENIHESPFSMTLPLLILAIGAVLAGYFGSDILKMIDGNLHFWKGSIYVLEANNSLEAMHHINHIYGILPLIASVTGIIAAFGIYMARPIIAKLTVKKFYFIYNFLNNKWYFDQLYKFLFIQPAKKLGKFLWRKIDSIVIDGIPNGAAGISYSFAKILSVLQSGFIYHYASVIFLGMAGLLTWTLFFMS